MKEFPDFIFTSACGVYYEWIEKVDPEMFQEIKGRIQEGRWSLTGGWFLQPDCNIPCGESFARHGLITQRYFQEKFGTTAKTGYNVDSFGHNASLPQILKKSGMDHYVFMRPSLEEQGSKEILFLWQSADGTRIPTYRIPYFYNIDMTRPEVFQQIKEKADALEMDLMAFYGVGNHGGGPTIELLQLIEQMEIGETRYSSPDTYFAQIDPDKLPVIKGELQHHARGCYSECTFIKKGNRQCENNVLAAERFCLMANRLTGIRYPEKKLKKAWKNILMNQFHDILGGCAIKKAYEDAAYLYGEVMSITEQEIHYALQSIAQKIDTLQGRKLPGRAQIPPSYKVGNPDRWMLWETDGIGTPLVVFNPHTRAVRMPVEVNCIVAKVTDEQGMEIPFQQVRAPFTNGDKDRMQICFVAEVQPLGYRVYRLFTKREEEVSFPNEFLVTSHTMENSRIRVEWDTRTGDICCIYDKQKDCMILDGSCRAVVLDETQADTWAHDKVTLGETEGYFQNPQFSILETGAVRAVLRVTSYWKESVLQRDYCLEAGSDKVKVHVKVDFRQEHRTLKFAFPAKENEITVQIPFGTIRREKETGEEPCGNWIAAGKLGIANDGKYGYDTTKEEVRLTILRTAAYADHFAVRDEFCEIMDYGIHECSYVLFPYTENAKAQQTADEFNFGLRAVSTGFHSGNLPESDSCYQSQTEHIVVTAIKKSEDDDENVVRFYEADGQKEEVEIQIFGKEIRTCIAPYEIKTIRTDHTEVNLIEWQI